MKITCIIIEDEAISARRLQKMIERNKIGVMEILHSVKEAKDWFKKGIDPDIIFLDIQLGDGISFEIFEDFQPKSAIIFTTAFDEYALRAFKLNSIDYLLKPIQDKDLAQAIEKFKSTRNSLMYFSPLQIQELIRANFESKYRERFLVNVGQKWKSIETKEIALFFSENSATFLQTKGKNYLINNSLDELEEQLNPQDFFRINRNSLVHLSFIEEIISYAGHRLLLSLQGEKEKRIVSRERVQDFKVWLAR